MERLYELPKPTKLIREPAFKSMRSGTGVLQNQSANSPSAITTIRKKIHKTRDITTYSCPRENSYSFYSFTDVSELTYILLAKYVPIWSLLPLK